MLRRDGGGGRAVQTAFADVGFQLLVMVLPLMGSPLHSTESDVDAPEHAGTPSDPSAAAVPSAFVQIRADGGIWTEQRVVTEASVLEGLRRELPSQLLITVDSSAPYGVLHRLLQGADQIGIPVGIVERSQGGGP